MCVCMYVCVCVCMYVCVFMCEFFWGRWDAVGYFLTRTLIKRYQCNPNPAEHSGLNKKDFEYYNFTKLRLD